MIKLGFRLSLPAFGLAVLAFLAFASTPSPVRAATANEITSQPQRHAKAAAEQGNPEVTGTTTEDPATATQNTAAMEEKFRKLQKEMARDNGPGGLGASQTGGAAAKPKDAEPQPITVFTLAFKIGLGLIFVILLAVVTIRMLKKVQRGMLTKAGKQSGDIFEVMETCHLGSHQKIVALRMNDEVGVIGVTQQGINLLTILKEPAGEIRESRLGQGNSALFSDNLNKLLERFKKPKKVSDLLEET